MKPVKLRSKIDLVSYPARAEGLVNMDMPYIRFIRSVLFYTSFYSLSNTINRNSLTDKGCNTIGIKIILFLSRTLKDIRGVTVMVTGSDIGYLSSNPE